MKGLYLFIVLKGLVYSVLAESLTFEATHNFTFTYRDGNLYDSKWLNVRTEIKCVSQYFMVFSLKGYLFVLSRRDIFHSVLYKRDCPVEVAHNTYIYI